ncbi:hypothetical protein [Candidatus Avelusimicrobium alvi]|uniref:hypothetical protein n=1 Tax=Candidatus Avelusimicrobium alvi TaxID=3416221 RepID=UPI003D0BCBF3
MKARICLLGLALVCSACAAPSLRYKTEINRLSAAGKFREADERVTAKKNKLYKKKDAALFYLDRAALLHDAQDPAASDEMLASAQAYIDELYAKSVSASAGRLLINDLTTPYYAANYERALTYYYRAQNFLQRGDVSSAAVEARRAVFFLDHLRADKRKGYNDDPFVQYFASLVFESVGQLPDARIARQNAFNAYRRLGGKLGVSAPEFSVPKNAGELGEVIIFHYNGLLPLKKTQTVQVAWSEAAAMASSPQETTDSVSPEVQNALAAGLFGSAVTLSYPVLVPQPFRVASSFVEAGGQRYVTQKVADFAGAAKMDLDEKLPGIWFRTATRAVAKQVAAAQARQAAHSAANDDTVGDLAGMFVSVLGAALEKADTRQWFTLPAEVRMTRLFLTPKTQDIKLLFRDGYGNIIGEHVFENVPVERGGRIYLHHRTAN